MLDDESAGLPIFNCKKLISSSERACYGWLSEIKLTLKFLLLMYMCLAYAAPSE